MTIGLKLGQLHGAIASSAAHTGDDRLTAAAAGVCYPMIYLVHFYCQQSNNQKKSIKNKNETSLFQTQH